MTQLDFLTLGFGIGAPQAAEGATFEKNHRPDARSIIERVFLDVVDDTFGFQLRTLRYHYRLTGTKSVSAQFWL